jgi:hypothetical protein
MKSLLSFCILMFVKCFSKVFYRLEKTWISEIKDDYSDIRLVMLLNHTSLFEPLYVNAAPTSFIWEFSKKMVLPIADKTLKRPIVGFFFKFIGPKVISITRKRDKSWFQFLKFIEDKSIIVIAPEGRMKRSSGLDSTGKPMSVRSGIAEIIEALDEGRILIAYSAGLHHVQHPGQSLPKLFKTLKLNLEVIDIKDYKSQFTTEGVPFRRDVVNDLEDRIKNKVPAL